MFCIGDSLQFAREGEREREKKKGEARNVSESALSGSFGAILQTDLKAAAPRRLETIPRAG